MGIRRVSLISVLASMVGLPFLSLAQASAPAQKAISDTDQGFRVL